MFTSASRREVRLATWAAARRTESSEVTSMGTSVSRSRCSAGRSPRARALSGLRTPANTRCPSSRKRRVKARPMPRLAPVTRIFCMSAAEPSPDLEPVPGPYTGRSSSGVEPLDDRARKLGRAQRSADVARLLAFFERAIVGAANALTRAAAGFVPARVGQVLEQHRAAHQQSQGIGKVLTRDVRRRTVYGFEHRVVVTDVRAGRHAQTADQACAQIRTDVAVQVLAHHDVELCRILHHLHLR